MSGVFRSLRYLHKFWLAGLGALASLFLVNIGNLITPQLLRILIDQGITSLDFNVILLAASALVGVAVLRGVFNFLQGYLSEVTSQGIAYELRNSIFDKLQRISFSYHDRHQTGKLMTRMTSDVELVRMFVGQGLLQLVSGFVMLIGTTVVLFLMNWLLALVTLAVIPGILVILFLLIRNVMPAARTIQQKLGGLNTILQENIAGLRVVKAFARENYELDRYHRKNQELLSDNIFLLKQFTNYFPTIFFFANLSVLGVVWVGGIQVIGDRLTLGELVAFLGYQGFMLMPIFILGMVGAMLSRAEASAQRIFEVIDAQSEVTEKPGAYPLHRIDGTVSFDRVSFRYAGSGEDVLTEISFTARQGQTVAILGQTGSGKSTIINLIPRFYDVTKGRLTVDGIDVREVTIPSLRSQIGVVLQDTTLFSGTIRENIAYGKPNSSLDAIVKAAKAAQAHEFIQALPDGYDTVIGERGVGLSGGQKQRISIARALLVDPKILILDDSTSAVDAETEHKIQKALTDLMRGRTSFVIAQRISTVRDADLILILDKGKLVARGKHEDLLKTSEQYVEILETQFGDRTEYLKIVEEELAW